MHRVIALIVIVIGGFTAATALEAEGMNRVRGRPAHFQTIHLGGVTGR